MVRDVAKGGTGAAARNLDSLMVMGSGYSIAIEYPDLPAGAGDRGVRADDEAISTS